jgi:prepilin-type N-terminal cleavage/methylation domain-containing protein/prepilin-type processing-associated H-X9-DG protein
MRRGFTLVELLVVVMIIVILVSIVTPSVYRAIELANQRACMANVKSIAEQCMAYMNDTKLHRRTNRANPMPTTDAAVTGWAENRLALWVLVAQNLVGRDSFLCPSAKTFRRMKAPDPGDTGFSSTTLSYSYLSQVSFTDNNYAGSSPVAYTGSYSRGLRASQLAVIADSNPRTVGTSDENGLNSKNHKREGQNVAFLDGHAGWFASPVIPGTKPRDSMNAMDDIYQPCAGGTDASGKRGAINDAFLIP